MSNLASVQEQNLLQQSQPEGDFLIPEFWQNNLADHPDRAFADRIVSHVSDGCPVGFEGPDECIISRNWPSSLDHNHAVDEFVDSNLKRGRMEGPLEKLPPNFRCSPLGAFQKRRSNKVRVIHDLSYPPGHSVNSFIDTEKHKVSYSTIDDVIKMGQQYINPYAYKIDIRSAYMACKVRPEDRHLLGYAWPDKSGTTRYYQYCCLPFGLSSAPGLFNEIADGLHYIMKKRGIPDTSSHYLDDYIAVDEGPTRASNGLKIMINTTNESGFEAHKIIEPTQVIDHIGYVVDFIKKELRISEDRMSEIYELLSEWEAKVTASKRDILSLIGKLQFCAKVIRDGSKFIRRLIDLSKRPKHLHHKVRISHQARLDLKWWRLCIKSHNGIQAFPREWSFDQTCIVFTDASDLAAGIVCGPFWSVFEFEGRYLWMKKKSIAWRELFAIVLCMATFGSILSDKFVTMNIDNIGMMHCINNGKSKDPSIMGLIRALYFYTSTFHISYKAVHISTGDNSSADALSRLDMVRFRQLNATACVEMTPPSECIIDF